MKTMIVYDSAYGNTEQIAKAIASGLQSTDEVTVHRVGELQSMPLLPLDRLIVGSPTQGGRPTQAIQEFINQLPATALQQIQVAAFDTRVAAQERGGWLRLLMGLLGYAAGRISHSLQAKGGVVVMPPEGFIVEGKEGPLKAGELERAAGWAAQFASIRHTLQYAVQ